MSYIYVYERRILYVKNCFNCKTTEKRQEIVQHYFLSPKAHTRILKNQVKISCTGSKLTDRYYLFQYQHKTNKNDKGSFFCGYTAAEDFLRLINHDGLPLFNPLKPEFDADDTTSRTRSGSTHNEPQREKWNDVALELYTAICMISICWNLEPSGPLLTLRTQVYENYNSPPTTSQISSVNTIILRGKGKYNKTLTEMINKLRAKDPRVRHFSFSKLEQAMKQKSGISYF